MATREYAVHPVGGGASLLPMVERNSGLWQDSLKLNGNRKAEERSE
jgi:hypothetical protein